MHTTKKRKKEENKNEHDDWVPVSGLVRFRFDNLPEMIGRAKLSLRLDLFLKLLLRGSASGPPNYMGTELKRPALMEAKGSE